VGREIRPDTLAQKTREKAVDRQKLKPSMNFVSSSVFNTSFLNPKALSPVPIFYCKTNKETLDRIMQAKLAIIYLQLVYTDFPALLVAQLFKRYLQLQTPKRPVFTELHPYN